MATDDKTIMGKITFINHEKEYATIEYEHNGKKKTISGNISEKEQEKLRKEKNEEGSAYLFTDDDLAKIIKVINNPSTYLNVKK